MHMINNLLGYILLKSFKESSPNGQLLNKSLIIILNLLNKKKSHFFILDRKKYFKI